MRKPVPHGVMRFLSLFLVITLNGCGAFNVDVQMPSSSPQPFVLESVAPTITIIPTLPTISTPILEAASTPTSDSISTITPSPVQPPEDWVIAYVANIIDDLENPIEDSHLEVRTVPLQEKRSRRLTEKYVDTTRPKWSPDGKRIAFIALDPEPNLLIIHKVESGQEYELPGGSIFDWSPDGQSIIYCSWGDAAKPPLEQYPCFVADMTDLTHPRQVIKPRWRAYDLQWSPIDDRILAYGAPEVGEDQNSHLYLFDLDGNVQEVKMQMDPWWDIVWNPNGKEITYAPHPDFEHRSNLRSIDLETMTEREITNIDAIAYYPKWSPDGTMLAYNVRLAIDLSQYNDPSNRPDIEKIHILNLVTGETIEIAKPKLYTAYPSWSPDGKYLAFLQAVVYPSSNPLSTADFISGASLKILSIETGEIFTIIKRGVYGAGVSWQPLP